MSTKNAFEALSELGEVLPESPPSTPVAKHVRKPLVWIDLEMTGLDPAKDCIIQIAVIITDGFLAKVVEGPELTIHQPEGVLDGMNDWCKVQHGKSGLTQAVRESSLDLASAEDEVLEFIKSHVPDPQSSQLAGSTVHTDLAFLRAHMPRIAEHLDYRLVDVTTVAELARRWYPGAFLGRPRGTSSHTAMSDIRESIDMLRYFRRKIFQRP